MKELGHPQFDQLEKLDEALDVLKLVHKVSPDSLAEASAKRKVFSAYYGSTRFISRDKDHNLVIEHDYELIDILSGRIK